MRKKLQNMIHISLDTFHAVVQNISTELEALQEELEQIKSEYHR